MVSKRSCQHCGVGIRGWEAGKPGTIPRYCSGACRAAAARARGYQPPPKPPKPPRAPSACIDCGGEAGEPGKRGPLPKRCTNCVKLNQQSRSRAEYERKIADGRQDLQNVRRRKHEPRPCRDCGKCLRIGQRCRACSQSLRRNIGGPYQQAAARARVLERDQWTCQLCDQPIDALLAFPHPQSASIDHVLPLSVAFDRFGEDFDDTEDNWQAAHFGCNQAKGARVAS